MLKMTTHKSDLTASDIAELESCWCNDFGYTDAEVKWNVGSKRNHGHYGLYLLGDLVADIMICTECGDAYESMGGNYVDDLDYCLDCKSPLYDNSTGKDK